MVRCQEASVACSQDTSPSGRTLASLHRATSAQAQAHTGATIAPSPESARDVSLAVVATHEAGHAIGLAHSMSPTDVMGPFYYPGRVALSKGDAAAAEALYRV